MKGMPKINVTEKDLSWYYRQRGEGQLVVCMPGASTWGPSDRPTLCSTYQEFVTTYGTEVPKVDDISYNMAASYLKAGFRVLFYRFVATGAASASGRAPKDGESFVTATAKYSGSFGNNLKVSFTSAGDTSANVFVYNNLTGALLETLTVNFTDASADNYYAVVESDYLTFALTGTFSSTLFASATSVVLSGGLDTTSGEEKNYSSAIRTAILAEGALDDLLDPYQFTFDIMTSAGFNNYSDLDDNSVEKVDAKLVEIVKSRGNALYLVDGDPDAAYDAFYAYCGNFNTSYAAGIGPWGTARFLNTGSYRLLPGSYALLISWAQSCAEGSPVWMAPAGVKRASLEGFYKKPKYEVGKAILDSWQNHDYAKPDGYKVNPIMKAKQYGYVIYGNSTLLHNRSDGATSMLQLLSTRVLANLIKSKSFDISLSLQFDQMSDELYVQFKTLMGTYLDQLRYGGAIYDYEIVVDSSSVTRTDLNEKTVPVIIRISPTPAVENFDITLELSQAGVEFTDGSTEE